MQYEKRELIAEGKTKRVWATQNDRLRAIRHGVLQKAQ